jgi:hypothetical protein
MQSELRDRSNQALARISEQYYERGYLGKNMSHYLFSQHWRVAFFVLGALAASHVAWADVTIKGRLYYWNQEPATAEERASTPDLSGRYLPLRDNYVQVEFDVTTQDLELFSDAEGFFSVTKRNPLVGRWKVNLEIRAQVQLGTSGEARTQVSCFDSHSAIYPYNCQTGTVEIEADSTVSFDVYLGGPRSNIEEFWNKEEDTLPAFYNCQVIRQAYLAATLVETTRTADLNRPTFLTYPGDSAEHEYEPFTPPPGRAHIQVAKLRDTSASPTENAREWLDHRTGLVHEFGHKMMHDVYWTIPKALPNKLRFWESFDSNHHPLSCANPELGFVEGWAEFFGAWVARRPTLNGGSVYNLEHAWHPVLESGDNPTGELPSPEIGSLLWRSQLSGERRINEVENAAILWDLVDPPGEEFMAGDQQQLRPDGWPAALMFTDLLEDAQLNQLWSILKDHNPDCLLDEGDLWEDSLQYYWLKEFGDDPGKLHGLKAILFNRGITSTKQPEIAPSVTLDSISGDGRTVRLKVTEPDSEDRLQLRYNLAIQDAPGQKYRLLNRTDLRLQSAGFRPDDAGSAESEIALPPQWYRAIVLVHDNMLPVFLPLENPAYRSESTGSSEGAVAFSLIGTWEDGPDSHELGYWNGYVYLCQGPNGMQIIDLADPTNPRSVKKLFDPAGPKEDRLTILEAPVFRGPYAYVATKANLRVFDIAELPGTIRDVTGTQPQIPPWAVVSEGRTYFNPGVHQLALKDDLLFILSSNELYPRKTLSPPQSMDYFGRSTFSRRAIPGLVLPNNAFDFKEMVIAGNSLCGANLAGLTFFDISDLQQPRLKSFFALERAASVRLQPPHAFVLGHESLSVIDYSDISHPKLIWQQSSADSPQAIDIYERWLVVAVNRQAGKTNPRLLLYDVKKPSAPQLVGEWVYGHNSSSGFHGYPTSVHLHYLFPGTSRQGLYALVSCDAQDAALMVFRVNLPESTDPR